MYRVYSEKYVLDSQESYLQSPRAYKYVSVTRVPRKLQNV